jgi:putative addiction module component (TIGR02574 family)
MGKDYESAPILALPPSTRLRLVEEIWDSLAAEPSSVPVPDWHREELDRRLADGAAHTHGARAWDDVKQRLNSPRKRRPKS